jgi:HSP20 family molecular chaperone IbpA
VDPLKAKSSYKNGILEVSLPKRERGESKGENVRVE